VRFPDEDGREVDDETEPLETWEDWEELDFLAPEGSVERGGTLPASVLSEAREVLDDAEDGCHLHLHESDDD
jgi:cytosine/adenosine deaminase-related metal-dependent hydrolase